MIIPIQIGKQEKNPMKKSFLSICASLAIVVSVFISTTIVSGMATPASAKSISVDSYWKKIHHRKTMKCFERGSVPTGKTMYRTCGGKKYKVIGGSLSTGAHRKAWIQKRVRLTR